MYELSNKEGYRQFWAIYHRPPKEEYRYYLLERRGSLIPIDERSFKGAYYTPLAVVDKAYDKLTAGANYLEWNGKKWSIVNHFIPFTETEVGAPDRFESDFMVRYLSGKTLYAEAIQVIENSSHWFMSSGFWKVKYNSEFEFRGFIEYFYAKLLKHLVCCGVKDYIQRKMLWLFGKIIPLDQ